VLWLTLEVRAMSRVASPASRRLITSRSRQAIEAGDAWVAIAPAADF
jgi:hypothetical protein